MNKLRFFNLNGGILVAEKLLSYSHFHDSIPFSSFIQIKLCRNSHLSEFLTKKPFITLGTGSEIVEGLSFVSQMGAERTVLHYIYFGLHGRAQWSSG